MAAVEAAEQKDAKRKGAKPDRPGRQARTRGVSLNPDEQALVDEFQELTGLGFTEQVRQGVIARLPAANQLLRDMRAAGMSPSESPLAQQVVHEESEAERKALYKDDFIGAGAPAP